MNTSKFIAERFPLKASLPLTAALCAGPLSLLQFHWTDAIITFTMVFIIFLCLRITDDLASIHIDRLTHPTRGLPSGRIDAAKLKRYLLILIAAAAAISASGAFLISTLLIIVYYSLYFALFKKIPILVRPFLSNLIFFGLPAYIAQIISPQFSSPHLFLGLFAYASVIAHEYAHNVHSPDQTPSDEKTYVDLLGPRGLALLSFLVFALAALSGFAFWYASDQPPLFFIVLCLTTIQIFYLQVKLINQPVAHKAHPFYIYGFTFFLLPFIALAFDKVLKIGSFQ
jgi:4-hydroxybenzoate polyprenyltransferase